MMPARSSNDDAVPLHILDDVPTQPEAIVLEMVPDRRAAERSQRKRDALVGLPVLLAVIALLLVTVTALASGH